MRQFLAVALMACAIALVPTSRLHAQECNIGLVDCTLGAHHTSSNGSYGGSTHTACEMCQVGGVDSDAIYCHACPSNNLSEAYVAIRTAAAKGNVDEVLRLAHLVPGFVIFNEKRTAVQLTSCTAREIIASLAVVNAAQYRMAMGLARDLKHVGLGQ